MYICSQQFHRFIIVDTWNHSTILDFRNRGEESREKEQLQGKETEETGCICLQTDKAGEGNIGAGEEDIQTLGGDRRGGASGDEDEETGEEEHDPRGRARRGGRRPAGSSVAGGSCQAGRRLAGGICFQASSAAGGTCFPAGRSTTRGDELVEEEGDRRGAASPAGLARRGGGSPAGSASRRAAQLAGPASRRRLRSRSRRVRLSLPFSPLSFSSAAARGFFPRLELCARALARGAILSRAMARVARLARFRAA